MRINHLVLHNICQHEHLEWSFAPGLVAILGSNGQGKSNAMNAAYAVLSGDFSRHSKGKDGYIRQMTPEGETSYAEVSAEHGGTAFKLRRTLAPGNGKQALTIDGEVLTKAADIKHKLETVLGITPQLLSAYVFVAQWQMFAFISTPAERAKQFTQLCQTQHAEKLWDMLGKQIDLDRSIADQVVDNSDELRKQIADYDEKITETGRQLEQGRKGLLEPAKVTHLKQLLADHTRRTQLEATLPALRDKEAELLLGAKAAVAAHKQTASLSEVINESVESARAASDLAKTEQALFASQYKAWTDKQQLVKDLAKLVQPVRPAEADTQANSSAEIYNRKAKLEAKLFQHSDFLESLDAGSPCPTCGSPPEAFADKLAEHTAAVEKLTAEIAVCQKQYSAAMNREAVTKKWLEAESTYTTRKTMLEKQLSRAGEAEKPEDKKQEWAAAAADFSGAVAKARVLRGQLDAATTAKEEAKAKHKSAKARLEEAEKELAELPPTSEAAVANATLRLERHATSEKAVAGLEQRQEAYVEMRDDVSKQLETLLTLKERSAKAREWVSLLDATRAVMHRDRLPAIVHQQALEDLVDRVNETLEEFRAPFRVTAESDLAMIAHFEDGRMIAAPDLSGGEKMIFAAAFRLSVNAMFASQIGMMVLDEPTAALDERNTEHMANVFAGLGKVAKAQGHQILVITHEELLHPFFDQVLRVA